jgi:hypothetical protein
MLTVIANRCSETQARQMLTYSKSIRQNGSGNITILDSAQPIASFPWEQIGKYSPLNYAPQSTVAQPVNV